MMTLYFQAFFHIQRIFVVEKKLGTGKRARQEMGEMREMREMLIFQTVYNILMV